MKPPAPYDWTDVFMICLAFTLGLIGSITTPTPEECLKMRQCPHFVGDIYRSVGLECPLCREQREANDEMRLQSF